MFATDHKIKTLRSAKAQAVLKSKESMKEILKSRKTPKGDPFEISRAAGILAAKRTWELIPYCHPIPLDHIAIDFETSANEIKIIATVKAVWKTGVEMEALLAVQIASATLFDMLKPIFSEMEITDIQVLEKKGGKSDFQERIPKNFKVAVVVTSDGTFAGNREDKSGRLIQKRLEGFGISSADYRVLPDEREEILRALAEFYEKKFDLVLTTGGTGLGPRDVTAEATASFIEKPVPGIMESARFHGQERTPYAMLSRGVAGLKGKMLVVNLPGSSRGTVESLDAIFPAILHSYKMMEGGGHP